METTTKDVYTDVKDTHIYIDIYFRLSSSMEGPYISFSRAGVSHRDEIVVLVVPDAVPSLVHSSDSD